MYNTRVTFNGYEYSRYKVSFVRILIVDDDQQIVQFISKGLRQENYIVDCAYNGKNGLHLALTKHYDAAVIDIMLPELNGLDLINQLRQQDCRLPVIVLSAKSEVTDRINGLRAGGDDYLVKPFAFSELVARLQALHRRVYQTVESNILTVADLTVELSKRKVQRNGISIELQPKEFALLEYLLRNTGRVVSKTMIMEHVWDYNFDPRTTIVESRVCHLREKIDRPFNNDLIHTIRGIGYVLEQKT